MKNTPIVSIKDIDEILSSISVATIQQGHKYFKDKNGNRIMYLNVITAFDIETSYDNFSDTSVDDYQAWLYLWAFQIGERATIIGRTWEEFYALAYLINQHLEKRSARLLCYVHELSHEFQFLAGLWPFNEDDVMALKERTPLIALMGNIELRCSRRLADYSLEDWCKHLRTDHQKLEYDYTLVRYPWTELTDDEIKYCITDVICVVECVYKMMMLFEDTIYTIPYTSTGYIRRKVKTNLRYWSYGGMLSMQNSFDHYKKLCQALRGGDSYEALQYHDVILDDCDIYDIDSSYPSITVNCLLPMSAFRDEDATKEAINKCIEKKRCFVARIGFYDLRIKPQYYDFPYIQYFKAIKDCYTKPTDCDVNDNDRVYSASYIELAVTDVDLEIIENLYDHDHNRMHIYWLISARYGYVPQPLADIIINLYKQKTILKGDPDRDPEYTHVKRQLNAGCYGLMAQHMTFPKILFRDGKWIKDPDYNEEEDYNINVQKAYCNFAWSIWIAAIGRRRYLLGCLTALAAHPDAYVYGDTDSIVSRLPLDFDKYNRQRISEDRHSGACAADRDGNMHYMGVFEHKGKGLFRTVGIKQYVTHINGVTQISVSGVPKEKGSKIVADMGGVEAFELGFVFRDSGKTKSIYNDDIDDWVEIDGHQLHIIRNVAIVPTDYTLSDTMEYEQILEFFGRLDDLTN